MRGYGDSSKPAGVNNYTMDLLVEDVRALVLALGVERSPFLNIIFAFTVIPFVLRHLRLSNSYITYKYNNTVPVPYCNLVLGSRLRIREINWMDIKSYLAT